MDALIVLPPLAYQLNQGLNNGVNSTSLNAETEVSVIDNDFFEIQRTVQQLNLNQALIQYPKALIALHPIDAPLYMMDTPLLAQAQREMAVKVKLEDYLLQDIHCFDYIIRLNQNQHTNKNSNINASKLLIFEATCVLKTLLSQVYGYLNQCQQSHRTIIALSSLIPMVINADKGQSKTYTLNGWELWRNQYGAGAFPITDLDVYSLFNQHDKIDTTVNLSNNKPNKPLVFNNPYLKGSRIWRLWRWCLIFLGLSGLIFVLNNLWEWRQGVVQEQHLKVDIQNAFATALPNTPMVDPVMQLKSTLGMTDSTTNNIKNTKLTLFDTLKKIPTDWPNGSITHLDWKEGQLTITVNRSVLSSMSNNEANNTALIESLSLHHITVIWQ